MSKVKDALTRKIGPLPAWVYALVFGIGVYWYRNRRKAQVVLDPATQPGVMDSQIPQDQVTLSPGESVYDPNTGHLTGTAPEQLPPPERPPPVTLEPGETVYDPATGAVISGGPAPNDTSAAPAAAAAATVAGPKKRISKSYKRVVWDRRPKRKPQHKKAKKRTAKKPATKRSVAHLAVAPITSIGKTGGVVAAPGPSTYHPDSAPPPPQPAKTPAPAPYFPVVYRSPTAPVVKK